MQTGSKKPRARSTADVGADDPEQSKSFIDKAREIGADEEKSPAGELLGRLAKMPPDPKAKRRPDQ
jgi:hypothetical protein